MKWLIFGGGFLVVMVLVAFGTLMIIGGDSASVSEIETKHESAEVKKNENKETMPDTKAGETKAEDEEDESTILYKKINDMVTEHKKKHRI